MNFLYVILAAVLAVIVFPAEATMMEYDPVKALLPLQQTQLGVLPENVTCRHDLALVLNANNGNPACVKPSFVNILIKLGWAAQMEAGTVPDKTTYEQPAALAHMSPYIDVGFVEPEYLVECELEFYNLLQGFGADIPIMPTILTVKDELLYMNGDLTCDTHRKLKQVIAENPQVHTLVLQYVPGSIGDDDVHLSLTLWIREQGLNTHLESTSYIASGGADFFLGGVSRTMADGATIGVHSWFDGDAEAMDLPRNDSRHEPYTHAMTELLGSDEFYWFTIYAASSDDVHYMSNEEILDYRMLTEPIIDPLDDGAWVLYVAPSLEDCRGAVMQKCMLVRDSADGDWELFYGNITGFDYKPGYDYKLLVKTFKIEEMREGNSMLHYALIKVEIT